MIVTTSGTRAVFTDDLGQPLIGGKVYTYSIGTSLPKDSYKTGLLTTPNTNPIILDDAGSANLFLDGGYRIRVHDLNDIFIDERDNFYQGEAGFSSMPQGYAYDYFNNTLAVESQARKDAQAALEVDINKIRILALAGL